MRGSAHPASVFTPCVSLRGGWFLLCAAARATVGVTVCLAMVSFSDTRPAFAQPPAPHRPALAQPGDPPRPLLAQAATPSCPSLSAALATVVSPDPPVVDVLQKALDGAWPAPSDAAPLIDCLARNTEGLAAFRHAVADGVCDLPVDGSALRPSLSRLRLALALTLLDGLRASAEHHPETVEADLATLAAATRMLVAAPVTPLRVVGFSIVPRMAALAKRAGCPVPAVSLPSVADLAAFEKSKYLAAAARAGASDRGLEPHIVRAATALATEYIDPLARPLTAAEAEALADRFTTMYSEHGSRYRDMDPSQVTEMIPMPVPSPETLGKMVAEVVLCGRYLDTRLLFRVYGEARKALGISGSGGSAGRWAAAPTRQRTPR